MDTNGLRFWMLADEEQWFIRDTAAQVRYDGVRRSVRLASTRPLPPVTDAAADRDEAHARLARIPHTLDAYDTRAYWDDEAGAVMATGSFPEAVMIFMPPSGVAPSDLAMGYDGVLYVTLEGRVVLLDRLDRWAPVTLELPGFAAWRLAADPTGGVWVLDRDNRQLGRVQGLPLRERPHAEYAPGTFRPEEENPHPPTLAQLPDTGLAADVQPVAVACSPTGQVAVLTWREDEEAQLWRLIDTAQWAPPMRLRHARHPYSLAWVDDAHVALLLPGTLTEAPVYPVPDEAAEAEPVGDMYPLREYDGGPFLHGLRVPPHYPRGAAASAPLHRLSLPAFASQGTALNNMALDSGSAQTVWHRLYLEASIPAHCGIRVFLSATDDAVSAEELDAVIHPDDWHEHHFGERFAQEISAGVPRGTWVPSPSEIPLHPGFVLCEHEPGHAGLFTALVQRSNRRMRSLQGRFLHAKVVLSGDGRTSPELWAVRAYASRFSYVEHYLPELYRETEFGPEAEAVIPASEPSTTTPADFLSRFLMNFEGILTPLEDRVAHAYLLTDPYTTPDDALEWLGSWIGLSFDPAYPPSQRRRLLAEAPQLYRRRGTLPGLRQALNVATNDAVDGGEIVILEAFRLRRVLAIILGAGLADEEDPLLGGLVFSGNAIVGDTLVLGDEEHKEFLALFGADIPTEAAEDATIQALYDRLAYRVTVLVHREVTPQNLGLIRRVVELETPAHVLSQVVTASYPLLVGIASLVGVDTYLGPEQAPLPVRVGESYVGFRDVLRRPESFDPRLGGRRAAENWQERLRPLASPGEDMTIDMGASFTLDASRSQAGPRWRLAQYRWRLLE